MNLFECLKCYSAIGVWKRGPTNGTTQRDKGRYLTEEELFEKHYGEKYREYIVRAKSEGLKLKAFAWNAELGRRLGDPSKVQRDT